MAIFQATLKTHSRVDVTASAGELNECIVHECKPTIFKMVVGRRKEIFFTANCKHDDCGKIAYSVEEVAAAWNKWNPIPPIPPVK